MNLKANMLSYKYHQFQTGLNMMLLCGIISSVYYIVINIITPTHYPGYQIDAQTVSELSAIGAPSRKIWVLLCSFYSFLIIVFGMGIYVITEGNKRMRLIGALMFFYGVSGFFWPPMHQREVIAAGNATITDTLHLVFAGLTVVLMMTMIGLGVFSLGKKFRMYSILSIVALIIFGTLTGIDSKNISTGQPTPMIGIWERINISIFMIWVSVLSVDLLRSKKAVDASQYARRNAIE